MPIRDPIKKRAADKRYREKIKANPVRRQAHADYHSDYYRQRPWKTKIKAYQHFDVVRGYRSLTMQEGESIILGSSCFYCGVDEQALIGLDRKDNEDGHHLGNVVPACEVCNFILSDLPFEAKRLIAIGLTLSRQQGLLDNWIIKTKRRSDRTNTNP